MSSNIHSKPLRQVSFTDHTLDLNYKSTISSFRHSILFNHPWYIDLQYLLLESDWEIGLDVDQFHHIILKLTPTIKLNNLDFLMKLFSTNVCKLWTCPLMVHNQSTKKSIEDITCKERYTDRRSRINLPKIQRNIKKMWFKPR